MPAYLRLSLALLVCVVAIAALSPLSPLLTAGAGLALALLLLTLHRRGLAGARAGTRASELPAVEEPVDDERTTELIAADKGALVLDVDRDGIIRSCSGAAGVLGYQPAELIDTPLFRLIHTDDVVAAGTRTHRYLRRDGSHVTLETSRITRRDALGVSVGSFTVLREPSREPVRSVAARIAAAVALEPDPVEIFTIVAEEVGVALNVPAVAVIRFESGGFGTVAGAWQAGGVPDLVPGARVDLDPASVPGQPFAEKPAVPGGAPIRIGNKPWGVLVAEGADADRLASLAEIVHSALAYADAGARLSSLGTRDALTNLPDHRAFHEQLRAEVRRARRHKRALSLMLVNLDGFRHLNEEHGRLAGDRVLAEAAHRLGAAVRQGELVSRVGADHFAWILPETEGLNGWIGAERARRAISTTPFEGVGAVTASAGVSDLENAEGADELLALAEVALVHAKSSGGDATFRYSEELTRVAGELREHDRAMDRLRSLARQADAEVPGTENHSERVARLAEKLAVAAGWSAEQAVRLGQAGALHDVGKLTVEGEVLRKPGPLDERELEQIRGHPNSSAEITVDALDPEQQSWVRHHHERWDGLGYPSRLSGELIPAGARLLALAEAWDAMTSSTVYGDALSVTEALAECRSESGFQFAPEAVAALDRLWALGAIEPATDVRASTS